MDPDRYSLLQPDNIPDVDQCAENQKDASALLDPFHLGSAGDHYGNPQAPIQILHEMACNYADQLQRIYEECTKNNPRDHQKAAEECCNYLYGKKEEIKVLFSENAGRHLERATTDIMDRMQKTQPSWNADDDERRLFISASGMAAYGLLICWLTEDIQKTPHDIVMIMDRIFGVKTDHSAFEEVFS